LERDTQAAKIFSETSKPEPGYVNVEMNDLIVALADVMARAEMFESHQIQFETLSTRERMSDVLERISNGEFVVFNQLFSIEEGKIGVVVTFLAIMELLKERLVDIVQNELFGSIHLRLKKNEF